MEGRVVLVVLKIFQFMILLGVFLQVPISTTAENIDGIEETNLDFDIPSEAFNASIKDHHQIVVCRVNADSKRRDLRAKYDIFDANSSFDGNLCTHLVYGPFYISTTYQLEDTEYIDDLSEIAILSKRYPHLKLLMEIGISKNATEVLKLTQLGVQLQENHFLLITNLKNIIKNCEFNGVFLDRSFHHSVNNAAAFDKYVTSKSISTEETLGEYLADEFHKDDLLVTAEIGMYHKQIVQNAQKSWQNFVTTLSYARVAEMSKIYDFVVVNGYKTDFRQTSISSYIAPLYSTEERHFNIYDRLKTILVDWKAYSNNLVLAVPFFGYPFLLYNSNSSSFGYLTAADPKGFAGPLLRQKTYWGYNEICYTTILNKNVWKMYWDSRAKVPFMKKGNHWISFDNWRSIKEKVLLAMSFGLKGILADSADMDDNHCAHTKNPLLKSINYALKTSMTVPIVLCNFSDSTFDNNKAPIMHTDFYITQVKLNTTIQINCTAEGYPTPDIKLVNGNNDTINVIKDTQFTDKALCTVKKKQVTTLFLNSESSGKYSCVANNSAGEERRDFFLMNEDQPFVVVDKEIWIRKTHLDFTLPQITNITAVDGEQTLFCKISKQTIDVKRNYYDLKKAGDVFREKLCDVFIYGPFPVSIKFELEEKYSTQLNAVLNLTRSYPDLKMLLEISVEPFFTFGNHYAQFIIDFQNSIRRYGFIGVHFDSSFFVDSLRGSYQNEHSVEMLIIMQNLFQQTGLMMTMEIEINSENVFKNINQEQLHKMIKIFNYIFVKTYDLTTSTASKVTSHNAPLPSSKRQIQNILSNLENLFEEDRSKNYSSLIFGIPFNAYFYLLKDSNPFAFGFNASSMISKQNSSYGHVCHTAMQNNAINWEMFWDNAARVPFLRNRQLWFTLENPKSVFEKFLFYLSLHKEFKFKGIMVDSIDKDDFLGDCGNITYPLLRTTHSAMNEAKNFGKNSNIPSALDWWWVAATATISLILLSVAIICGQLVYTYINKKTDRLSKKEIEVFIWGNNHNNHVTNSEDDIEKKPEAMPYDTSFEISPDMYEIDTQNILGCGAFGVVYKGKVHDGFVAVKSVKPGADIQFLKSLLSELKILIYLENHPNIVNLIGADTTKLKKGIVFIFVEFCPLGNLQEYLRQSRPNFRGLPNKSHTYNNWEPKDIEMDVKVKNPLSARHLVIWCHQIAKALEHLNHKKIIHGDLATRNVLVFERELVKITDFGLSRKLYNYSEYVKKNQEPLPWRWLAIESLRDLTFSTQSDIWSFGITMWEIFSLAETPYPGLAWSPEFLQLLKGNLRMQKPIHATSELYDFMLECWNENPSDRPKAEDAASFFCNLIKSTVFKRYSKHETIPIPVGEDGYTPEDFSIIPQNI